MVEKITWLTGAQITFENAIAYLQNNFTEKEVSNFSDKVNKKLALVRQNPRLGKRSLKKNVYRTVIHKRVVLIYEYKPRKKEIALIVFWNTLQDPRKINK